MISLRDALVLARTKTKTRKIRMAITVGTSGILFGVLIAASLVMNGIQRSVDSFSKEGLGSRYIAQATVVNGDMNGYDYNAIRTNPELIARAEALQSERIKNKQADAKQLGIDYDSASEPKAVAVEDGVKALQYDSHVGQQVQKEYETATYPVVPPSQHVKTVLSQYSIKQLYGETTIQVFTGQWRSMKNGKEDFDAKSSEVMTDTFNERSDPIMNGVTIMEGTLTDPFLTKKQLWQPSHKTIPVIITYAQAEKYLGYKALSSSASAREKLQRIADIRAKIPGYRIDTCYRNASSVQAIDTVKQQQKELKANANNKNYQKPQKIESLPESTSCGAPVTTSDTRTAADKKTQENALIFGKKYDGIVEPMQQKYTFEVVGLSPGTPSMQNSLVSSVVQGILNPTLSTGWIVPKNLYSQLATADATLHIVSDKEQLSSFVQNVYVEFSSYDDALSAIKKFSCMYNCDDNKNLFLTTFGSGSIALEQIRESLNDIVRYAVLGTVVIAGVIMMGTIGRTIADSRRETAVFRAMGAKRRDISTVYFVYAVLLALRVIVFAVILAIVAVVIIDTIFSPDASVNAQLIFGTSDLSKQFQFIGFNSVELFSIALIIVTCALLSAIIPLLRGVRRNPINDMRDDT